MVTIMREEPGDGLAKTSDLLLCAAKSSTKEAHVFQYQIINLELHGQCPVHAAYDGHGDELKEGAVILIGSPDEKGIEDLLGCNINDSGRLEGMGIRPMRQYCLTVDMVRSNALADSRPGFESE